MKLRGGMLEGCEQIENEIHSCKMKMKLRRIENKVAKEEKPIQQYILFHLRRAWLLVSQAMIAGYLLYRVILNYVKLYFLFYPIIV